MKSIWREILMAIFMGMILPGIVVNYGVCELHTSHPEPSQGTASEESMTMLFHTSAGEVTQMEMDDYLLGVLLAEMPGSFETEAFKAQAVASRTYTLRASKTGGKHGDGSVCGDSLCCQAYLSEEAYLGRGGSRETVERVRQAIKATSGEVLTYEGELIEATYFSCSGGSTEDAVEVWGTQIPYLQAVESPGEEYAAHYRDTVRFSLNEFASLLDVSLIGSGWLGAAEYTQGGGVRSIAIGDKRFSGTELRSLLGLRSTNFTIQADSDGVTVTTQGFGHRVGMSQYGADAMAASGKTYRQILSHYYQGTELTNSEN